MVQILVRLTAASGRAHQLVQALRSVMRQALLDRGCSGAHIAADVTEADVYWYCEDWCGLEDLERQLKTERFVRLLGLLEIGPRAPLLEFRVIAETRGLDYVATVRGNFAAEHRSRR